MAFCSVLAVPLEFSEKSNRHCFADSPLTEAPAEII